MNWPLQKIHDVESSYGRLLIPLWHGRWLMLSERYGVRVTSRHGFHNCTRTGVY